ncbi:hypothetical protein LCGC14_0586470 [marine sediment metagenome]|uniref:Terminase large subunit gp17-like C-terminal domain-containing protein n=1 Tax=marine sediment metagenome TaxID=412755 RepID=A0A0F9U116_9ZZZZ
MVESWLTAFNKQKKYFEIREELPKVPSDILDWIREVRPKAEGRTRIIMPPWRDIYNDDSYNKFIVGGRQIFKSTYTTDVLAFEATSMKNAQLVYCTYDDVNKAAFSRQKLQVGTFEGSEILKKFVRFRLGSVGEISLLNKSTIYITTDHGQYHHVEGKSAQHVMLDEAQYQDMQYFDRIPLIMTITQGKISVLGVGGEAGSPYEQIWKDSDQREWIFDNNEDYIDSDGQIFKGQGWRNDLIFGEVEDEFTGKIKWGLVADNRLMKIMSGRWKAAFPEKSRDWHGYHIPQHIIPQIPLSIADAIDPKKYNTEKKYAIEAKQMKMSPHLFTSHVIGLFYHAERRPITTQMIDALFAGNKEHKIMKPWEIADIKDQFGSEVKIAMGIDFGSGSPSQTVICIMIKWILQPETSKQEEIARIQLVHLDPRPAENLLDQAKNIAILFDECKCDVGVGDLGYGAIQVEQIQDGGSDRLTGQHFNGVGSDRFYGCRSIGDETKPLLEYTKDLDEHGETREHIKIDKTSVIQDWVDLMTVQVNDPDDPYNLDKRKPKLIFPAEKYSKQSINFLYHDLTNLTRKDLSDKIDEEEEDPRQKARKEFNHPRDSLMAMIYAIQAFKVQQDWNWVGVG